MEDRLGPITPSQQTNEGIYSSNADAPFDQKFMYIDVFCATVQSKLQCGENIFEVTFSSYT